MSSQAHRLISGKVEARIISTMRLVLAISALLISAVAPPVADGLAAVLFTVLALYTGYCALLYALARRASSRLPAVRSWTHWADVAWSVVLVALSGGAGSIFFFFFFFAILVACFRWGFASGLRVTVISALLFSIVGLATTLSGGDFELAGFLLRLISLLALGYMMAYWGGSEITLKRYLVMLSEVTRLSSNPRFGMDRTLGQIMERLRAFYDADACLLATFDPASGEYHLRRASRQDPEGAVRESSIPPEIGRQLLALPAEQVVMYNSHGWAPWRRRPRCYAYDMLTGARCDTAEATLEALATTLDGKAYITVPMRHHNEFAGRYYLVVEQAIFYESDPVFVLQVVEQVVPAIVNIRLVDRVAMRAAEEERQRIVRDLNDRVIQSFVALQLGLSTSREKLAAGGPDAALWVDRLRELTDAGLADIRAHMRGLQGAGEYEGSLVSAVRRFAQKFTEATGIAVQLETATNLLIDDRLAAEVFQLVTEGLNNIRAHTESTKALIGLEKKNDMFILRIEHERTGSAAPEPSTPGSLTEHAAALGGHAYIDSHVDGRTGVIVEIPL